jgi:hypothetical protein
MVEARAGAMGQYSHNNQPGHHVLFLFALLGELSVVVLCAVCYDDDDFLNCYLRISCMLAQLTLKYLTL